MVGYVALRHADRSPPGVKLGVSNPPANVYVVDDDPQLREGVTEWLSDAGYHVKSFPSGASLLAAHPKLPPGCIIVDMRMPNMSGLELKQELVTAGCYWPVVLLTGHATRAEVTRAMEAGVASFLEKPLREAELLAAVIRGQAQLFGTVEIIPDPQLAQRFTRLTERENQVLDFVFQQKLAKQIAAVLGIRETTVKGYKRGLMKKLGVHNIPELVVLSIRGGRYKPPKF